MYYQNIIIIIACIFATNYVILCRNLYVPRESIDIYLVGHSKLIFPENSHCSGNLYRMHVRDYGRVMLLMSHARNHYQYLIRRIKKDGDFAVRCSISNPLLRNPSRDYWTEMKTIKKSIIYSKYS